MYLEKLKIQGFKSFASKNKLSFPGAVNSQKRGITAVVGPNGSGKSNIADAIRWVLGEQSMKTIRAKLGEDVIFSGTQNKAKLNMAEVSLYLNNQGEKEGGVGQKAPIPYSEVVLTRRVYRNGENEYLINNNKTKLSEIQMLLAKASFGQKTYSVIGQGMVENFLKVTPRERKEFFDEATGIKEFQIKRESSLNKLLNSYKNLEQAGLLIKEIEPRLNSLTRQVKKLHKKDHLETELKQLSQRFFKYKWHKLNDQFVYFNNQFLKTEEEKQAKENKLSRLNKDFNKVQEEKGVSEKFNYWSEIISDLQKKREGLIQKLATLEAQRKMNLENKGNFDLSWLESRQTRINKEREGLETKKQKLKQKLKNQKTEQEEINKKIQEQNEKHKKIFSQTEKNLSWENKINQELTQAHQEIKEACQQNSLEKIKKRLNQIRHQIKKIIKNIPRSGQEKEIKKHQEELIKLNEEKNQKEVEINSLKEKLNLLSEQTKKLEEEKNEIEEKIKKYSGKNKESKTEEKQNREKLQTEIKKIDKETNKARTELNKLGEIEKEKKEKITKLQQNSQELQKEINELNNRLNEARVNSAKFETKLEDWETKIKNSVYNDLKEIKQNRLQGKINPTETEEKINKIQNQLNQIGAIDPETETEYHQTKEKYDFLNEQITDLRKAIKGLENIIKELDVNIKERFEKEFRRIHKNFEKYFKILFNGGEAKITAVHPEKSQEEKETNEDNKEENKIAKLAKSNATGIEGIDIQVHPPGKKIASISMLSGGEKALTAIALICAIISSNPSPFVVLDEVDAALDEANSERFAKILDDLSYKTQFILITHNRASMHKANVLYGTTMDENGISKLLSIKMEGEEKEKK